MRNQSTTLAIAASVAAFLVGPGSRANAQCVTIDADILTASDARERQYFGNSVAIYNDVAVVGAHFDAPLRAGAAYVFRFDGDAWIEEAKLTASDASEHDNFGVAVAVSGDVALIGAFHDDDGATDAGAAYVFRFDGEAWTEEAKLTASVPDASDQFGGVIALDGEVAVIGVGNDDEGGMHAGAAYVFRFDGAEWQEEAKLTASDRWRFDTFGFSVAIDGPIVVVGSPGDNVDTGAAYVFGYDGAAWVETAKIIAADGEDFDEFGSAVAVHGAVIAIGAVENDEGALNGGAAYVYRLGEGQWQQESKILGQFTAEEFASAIALRGSQLLVGSPFHEVSGIPTAGAAYLYHFNGGVWEEQFELTNAPVDRFDQFGTSLSLSNRHLIVGAPDDDHSGLSSPGSARVFEIECPCEEDLDDSGTVDFGDLLAILSAWGPCGEDCPEDLDGSGDVGFGDLLIVLGAWGPCATGVWPD